MVSLQKGGGEVSTFYLCSSKTLAWGAPTVGVAIGGSGLIRGVSIGGSGLIRAVAIGRSGLIRGDYYIRKQIELISKHFWRKKSEMPLNFIQKTLNKNTCDIYFYNERHSFLILSWHPTKFIIHPFFKEL